MADGKRLTPCLWFNTQAEQAAEFYVSIFPDSKVTNIARWGETGPGQAGSVLSVEFELSGNPFTALNGGPEFSFSEAISFQIPCEDQAEIDHYWERLLADGGEPSQCGWLKDRFGVSWQVFPRRLPELLSDPDPQIAGRVMNAMLAMAKIELAPLEAAARGE